jgi:hypothetical protein
MLVSALGKYRLGDLVREYVGSLSRDLADALNFPFVYA